MLVIITNNPLIQETYGSTYTVDYEALSYDDILMKIRDAVHRGASVLTHPLYGSVKPKETPYRSVLMDMREGPVDMDSLLLIEQTIASAGKFPNKSAGYDEGTLNDCRVIDLSLLQGALGSMQSPPCDFEKEVTETR